MLELALCAELLVMFGVWLDGARETSEDVGLEGDWVADGLVDAM